jgi:TrmH family RNA methyltransferase
VEGAKTVGDCLHDELIRIETIYTTDAWHEHARHISIPATITQVQVEEHELKSISGLTTPQQVLAVGEMPDQIANPALINAELCLYLDGIRDPGNMGTIFRIADWFGLGAIFLAEDCVDPYNPKVIQSSMSSLFRVKWAEVPLSEFLAMQEAKIFATASDGQSMYESNLSKSGLIILGNESTGIRGLDDMMGIQKIAIPDAFRLGAESLNVAVSAGIICAEFRRRFMG